MQGGINLLRRLEAQSIWRMTYSVLPRQPFSAAPQLDDGAEARQEWYDDASVSAQEALRLLVQRIQATGSPVKQAHLQALYERCTSGEELEKALRLTRLNSLARADLRQHQPFSHRTSQALVRRAVVVDAPDVAQRALRSPADFGLATAAVKEFHPLLIYYSKKGDLARMLEVYEHMRSSGRAPSQETCHVLVKGCVDNGRPDLAELTIKDFEEAGARVRGGTRLYLEQNRGKAAPVAAAAEAAEGGSSGDAAS